MKLVHHKNRLPDKPWGCPLTKNRSNWCHAHCTPINTIGACGRVAPHALRGRTQRAIRMCNLKEESLQVQTVGAIQG